MGGGCCRRGNEPLGCINMCGIYLLAEELSASQEGLCYVQLAAVGMLCCEVLVMRLICGEGQVSKVGGQVSKVGGQVSVGSSLDVHTAPWRLLKRNTLGGAKSLVISCQLHSCSRNSPQFMEPRVHYRAHKSPLYVPVWYTLN